MVLHICYTFLQIQVETALPEYHPVYQSLRQVDLACSCLFLLEWAFWLWLAHDRWRYLFSSQSVLDLATTIPIFVSFAAHHEVRMQGTRDATDNSRISAVEQLPAALRTSAIRQAVGLHSIIHVPHH
jgi:hypothetical protein